MVKMNRRSYLSKAGAALVGLSTIPVVNAKERDPRKIRDQARHIRAKTGSHERFVEYMRDHMDSVTTSKKEFSLPSVKNQEDSDGVSTQKFEENEEDLTAYLTLSNYYYAACGGEDYASIDYTIDVNTDDYGEGEPGLDRLTLGWNDDHYRIQYGSEYTSSNKHLSHKESAFNGCNFRWDDNEACSYGCNVSLSVGCDAEHLSTNQERAVRGEYHHVWNEAELSNFGVTSSGDATFSISSSSYYWEGADLIREEGQSSTGGFC